MLFRSSTAPSATTLYNYDTNRDTAPGRVVFKGGSGQGETDPTKYLNWRTANFPTSDPINGTVRVTFWSAAKNFAQNKRLKVVAFLREFNPSNGTYVELANATLDVANWQGGSTTWVSKTIDIAVSNKTVAAGRRLELKLINHADSGDDLWLAYDTTTYSSNVVEIGRASCRERV